MSKKPAQQAIPPGLREKAAHLAYKAERYEEAVKLGAECILENPSHRNILFFSNAANGMPDIPFTPEVKKALIVCLQATSIEQQGMFHLWLSTLKADPVHRHLVALMSHSSYEDFESALEWKHLQDALQDGLIIHSLKTIVLMRPETERVMTHLRRWILKSVVENNNAVRQKHLPFLTALAENCHYNEYVFCVSEEEEISIKKLAQEPWADPVKTAMLACYEPLYAFAASKPHAPHPALKDLIKTQLDDRAEELRLMETLPSIGTISNETSKAVQSMYEENPYPRWRTINMPMGGGPDVRGDYLIAGCGTGRTATQTPILFPNLTCTAIDITRRSLSYAMRKSKEYGVKNMRFAHCDILEVGKLEGSFDFIECGGVLHHMKDPVAGWRELVKKLKPGGAMFIGLYSTAARDVVAAARALVKERGYESTPAGIRAFRKEMMSLPPENPFERLITTRNFYTLSECRDLVFHIQEHTYTIPEIKKILDELDLAFLGFRADSPQRAAVYRKLFPDDPHMLSLDNFILIEQKIPSWFFGMYQFVCRPKADVGKPCLGFENIEKSGFFRETI